MLPKQKSDKEKRVKGGGGGGGGVEAAQAADSKNKNKKNQKIKKGPEEKVEKKSSIPKAAEPDTKQTRSQKRRLRRQKQGSVDNNTSGNVEPEKVKTKNVVADEGAGKNGVEPHVVSEPQTTGTNLNENGSLHQKKKKDKKEPDSAVKHENSENVIVSSDENQAVEKSTKTKKDKKRKEASGSEAVKGEDDVQPQKKRDVAVVGEKKNTVPDEGTGKKDVESKMEIEPQTTDTISTEKGSLHKKKKDSKDL